MDARKTLEKFAKASPAGLVIGILLLAGALVCGFLGIASLGHDYRAEAVDFDPFLSRYNGSYAYLDITGVSDWVCGYDGGETYYAAEDDYGYYIVALKDADFENMEKHMDYWNRESDSMRAPTPYRVYGIVEPIESEVRDSFRESFDLSNTEFINIFGSYYLNTTKNPGSENAGVPLFFGFMLLLLGLAVLIPALIRNKNAKRSLDELEEKGQLQAAAEELENPANTVIGKGNGRCILGQRFVFSKAAGGRVLRYEDILWVYKRQQRTNGIASGASLVANTLEKRGLTLATAPGKDKNGILQQLADLLYEHNPALLVGYTTENNSAYNARVQAAKNQ